MMILSQSSTSVRNDPCCERKRRPINDIFFAKGDRIAFADNNNNNNHSDSSTVAIFYVEEERIESFDDDDQHHCDCHHPTVMKNNEERENGPLVDDLQYSCPCCPKQFHSIADCDSHYEACHFFECHVCRAVFPIHFLLDLHLQEAHDSYFAVAIEKQQKHHQPQRGDGVGRTVPVAPTYYKCLVPDCSVEGAAADGTPSVAGFRSVRDRQEHLRAHHGFPKWYRFLPKSTLYRQQYKLLSSATTTTNNSSTAIRKKKKKKNWSSQPHNTIQNKQNGFHAATDTQTTMTTTPLVLPVQQQHELEEIQMNNHNNNADEKKHYRREKQKAKRASTPCKFFASVGGCWRGETCMFMHAVVPLPLSCGALLPQQDTRNDTIATTTTNTTTTSSVVMEDLANRMVRKATITVPKNVSFGRRRKA